MSTRWSMWRGLWNVLSLSTIDIAMNGCQIAGAPAVTAMHLASVADQAHTSARTEKLLEGYRQHIRDLQAHGDPMGDYLYAIGNEQGWIEDTKDPLIIESFLKKAKSNGSIDAEIALGIFYFSGVIPGAGTTAPVWLRNASLDRARGLELIRKGISHRCTYAVPIIDPYANRTYLRCVSAAGKIWPHFRDGDYERDASGHYVPTLNSDPHREKEWRDIDSRCRASGATNQDM